MTRDTKPFMFAGTMVLVISFPAMVAVCWLITSDFRTTIQLAETFRNQIIAGFIAMFAFLFATSRVAPACERSLSVAGTYFVAVFLVGAVAASSTSLWLNPVCSSDTTASRLYGYVVKPMIALSLFGTVPAFFIGSLEHWILKSLLICERSKHP